MKLTKKLINDPKDAVTEYLEGYVSSVEHVQLLEGAPDVSSDAGPFRSQPRLTECMQTPQDCPPQLKACCLQINVVTRTPPVDDSKVAIISGAAFSACGHHYHCP